MLLETKNLQLLPFDTTDWQDIARWFYDLDYSGFFRHQPKILKPADFQNYPQITRSDVFIAREKSTNKTVGMVQLIADGKSNRAFYVGVIVDKEFQGHKYPAEMLFLMGDYCFNRMGYRKAIMEILESNTSLKRTIVENGWLFEGKLIGECFRDGQFVNELRYCMMESYFNKRIKPTLESWK